ncbi:MAG TPA: (d)CMP kinase [Candidatus Acidoferrum sp.]|nr:(d)CMP kinase [Candidatus Acidoferrum sp.]
MAGSAAPRTLLVVAVDGPSAAGKGTLGRGIARHFGLAFLDTGLLYRAVGARLLAAGQDPADPRAAEAAAKALEFSELDSPALRDDRVAQAASKVAAIPGVRQALLGLQRQFAATPPPGPDGQVRGAVLDGRDIGTVVCPDATVKLFVTASLEARAQRRHQELLGRSGESIYARVLQDMKERDARDSSRAVAPLTPAPDAMVLDTTALSTEAALAAAVTFIGRRWRGEKVSSLA